MIFQNNPHLPKTFKKFVDIMGVKPVHVLIPVILSFIASVLEGLSLGLLAPIVVGVIKSDYSFLQNKPIIGDILRGFYKHSSDFITEQKSIFLFMAVLIFLTSSLKYIIEYISRVYSNYWNGIYSKRMSVFVFNRFLGFGNLYFDRIGQSYVSTVMGHTEKFLSLFDLIQNTIRESFYIIIILIVMSVISWKLVLFTVLLFPVLNFALRGIVKRIIELAQRDSQACVGLNKSLFNVLSCLPLIMAYSKEKQVSQEFEKSAEARRQLVFWRDSIGSLATPIQYIIIRLTILGMVAFVAFFMAKDKTVDLAVFMVFFYLAIYVLPKFAVFNTAKIDFANLKQPMLEITKILKDEGKEIIREGNKNFEGIKEGIKIDHLSFFYGEGRGALNDISCFIEKGKVTAIVGATGSGKTTFINLVLRLYNCPPGTIKIDGVDIGEFKLNSLRAHMSVVTQNNFLFNDTIRKNISFGVNRDVSDQELWGVLKRARLYDFVTSLPDKLDTQIGDRGVKISGGEQQRISIAMALLRDTDILMLDEATSFLDSKTEGLIRQSIDEAIKGKTTIVIAHRFSTIKNADKIIVLENGAIVEQGPLDELLKNKGRFYEYWETQKFH